MQIKPAIRLTEVKPCQSLSVVMWGYFNSKGQGNFIRMHIILDP